MGGWMLRVALLALAGCVTATVSAAPAASVVAGDLAVAPVRLVEAAPRRSFDGVVEAVRQTVVAAQVAGAVTALEVRAGDSVKAGQVLARIDARAAEQSASASEAQVAAAQALLEVSRKDFERQQQLFDRNYISQAALDRAESQFKATQAQARSQLSQARAAHTQSSFYVVRAPYAGVVAEVPAAVGDMALPGRALLTLYAPGALRVAAAVPQSALAGASAARLDGVRVEFPALPADRRWLEATSAQVLPTVDAATHTVTLRVPLPADLQGVAPGSFVRVWLPADAPESKAGTATSATPGQGPRLVIPASAVVRRAELTGVYVVDAKGVPQLRQVRLGLALGDGVEVLAGVAAGERVATDPQAAARVR